MRWDDTRGWLPESTRMTKQGLSAVISRTKTTGADKKVHALPLVISASVTLTDSCWLQTGYDIWTSKEFAAVRDYWLTLPTRDFHGSTGEMAEYSDTMALTKNMLKALCTPAIATQGQAKDRLIPGTTELLGPGQAAAFYTEHGDRAWVSSAAAELNFEKSRRDFCGRWKPDASDDYVRSARSVVRGVQDEIIHQLLSGKKLQEDDILEDYCRFLRTRTGATDAEAEAAAQALITPMWLWEYLHNVPRRPMTNEGNQEAEKLIQEESQQMGPSVIKEELQETEKLYWTLAAKNLKIFTVHRCGGCWRFPEMYAPDRVAFLPEIKEEDFFRICKQCWPDGMEFVPMSCDMHEVAHIPEDMSVCSEDESSSTCSASTTDMEEVNTVWP